MDERKFKSAVMKAVFETPPCRDSMCDYHACPHCISVKALEIYKASTGADHDS